MKVRKNNLQELKTMGRQQRGWRSRLWCTGVKLGSDVRFAIYDYAEGGGCVGIRMGRLRSWPSRIDLVAHA
ncbi:hypothetical protein AAC387_Pa04g1679 [Persea americana]